jgi:hypothetical protein
MITVDPRNPKGIVWIASYPKSGNTWMRVFLYQLMRIMGGHPREPDELNKLDRSSMYEAKLFGLFEQVIGKPLATANIIEVAKARERVHAMIAERVDNIALVKTHNVLGHIGTAPIINTKVSVGAIYVIRDPRDVAPSLARHLGSDIDEAIRVMAQNAFGTQNNAEAAFETWGSWSEHVLSWTMTPSEAILVVRYEDMHEKPLETFTAVVKHLGQAPSPEHIAEAIELSSFSGLKSQEDQYDFRERSPRSDRFFAEGRKGGWQETLTDAQAASIAETHGPLMRKFKYLS